MPPLFSCHKQISKVMPNESARHKRLNKICRPTGASKHNNDIIKTSKSKAPNSTLKKFKAKKRFCATTMFAAVLKRHKARTLAKHCRAPKSPNKMMQRTTATKNLWANKLPPTPKIQSEVATGNTPKTTQPKNKINVKKIKIIKNEKNNCKMVFSWGFS